MRPPAFWWQPAAGPAARLLEPLSWLYGKAAAGRIRRPGTRLPLPVICVGNFVAGGAGKTPAALALGQRLIARGERPFFLSRGYRSAAEHGAPVLVDLARHQAADVGDEPMLLARLAPTIVGADRVAAGRLAMANAASLLILDDGLQNPALEKDLRLVLVDGETGIGNGLCLPAGPLRAPLASQMDLASAVIIVGKGAAGASLAMRAGAADRPIINAEFVIPPEAAASLAGRSVFAFAGIALPRKFYASLAAVGAVIAGVKDFPDHHMYSFREVSALQRRARDCEATLVTTEKDFVRLSLLGPHMADPALPAPVAVPVALKFTEDLLLDEIVAAARARGCSRGSCGSG